MLATTATHKGEWVMGTLRDEIDAIDDRVRAATETLNESGTLGERLKNEFEGIWEAVQLIASRIDESEARTPPSA